MKNLKWILFTVLTIMTIALAAGCSQEDEPKENSIPRYDGGHLIIGDKIYIKLYAPEGMRYAPVSKEDIPEEAKIVDLRKNPEDLFFLENMVIFEGEYKGRHSYWCHGWWSSSFIPSLISPDGYSLDGGESFSEVCPELTCIYLGKDYRFAVIIHE